MKRILVLLLVLAALVVPVAAAELPDETPAEESVETVQDLADAPIVDATAEKDGEGVTVNVTIAQPETAVAASPEGDAERVEAAPSLPADDPLLVRSFSTSSPDALASGESGAVPAAMADVVTTVFGEYQRRTYTVSHYDASGNVIATSTELVPGLAGLDYAWLIGVVLFALVLCGFLRLIGGLLRR